MTKRERKELLKIMTEEELEEFCRKYDWEEVERIAKGYEERNGEKMSEIDKEFIFYMNQYERRFGTDALFTTIHMDYERAVELFKDALARGKPYSDRELGYPEDAII